MNKSRDRKYRAPRKRSQGLRALWMGIGGVLVWGAVGCSAQEFEGDEVGGDFFEPEAAEPESFGPGAPQPVMEPGVPEPEIIIPEPEERFNFRAPQPSRNYVFVANTGLDTVAKIDGDSLEITSIEVGDEPTVVRTWKEKNIAVVLNEGSRDVSIIHAAPDRDRVVTIPVREGFNQLVIAPGGDHAFAYLDYDEIELGDDIGRFQDVNLVRLIDGEEEVFNIAVGFRVLEIEFDADGERAFVVTEDGISIVEMAQVDRDINAQPIEVSDDPLEDARTIDREVEITGDGQLALVRTSALQGVNLIDLSDRRGRLVHIPLPSVPTDLDIYPDSSRALSVLKGARQVGVMELDRLGENPDDVRLIEIEEGPTGLAAVDFQENIALLYSIAEADPRVVRLDLDSGAQEVWDVRKAIQGVHIGPGGSRAVLYHAQGDAPRTEQAADVFIANSWAYTLLDMRSGFTKLQTVATEPGEFVFSENNDWMFLVLNDPIQDVRQVERIHLPSFRVDSYRLGSPPEHIGLLPSSQAPRVYISQQHPVGRMTFINIDSGDARTVTGFELNSQID